MPDAVTVVGQGYVGLVLAMRAVEAGFTVTAVESDAERLEHLRAGRSYLEDVGDEQLRAALDTCRFHPVAEMPGGGPATIVIAVPTPLVDGVPDLSHVRAACGAVGARLAPGSTVILESTTYPGTTEELVLEILERVSGLRCGRDFWLGYSPERIDPGNAAWTFTRIPKLVSGVDAASLERVRAFYERLVDTVVPVSRPREAELAKLLENTFRHVNVALVNEFAVLAHALGIDVWETIGAAATKPFGFLAFWPGPGVGGHCLPVDPLYLSWRVRLTADRPFRFVELANEVNRHMPGYVVDRLTAAFNLRGLSVRDRRVLLLGLAYKPDVGDLREAPALAVAQRLVALGADVRVADPHVRPADVPLGVTLVDLDPDALSSAEMVVLLVPHAAFDLALVSAQAKHVFDCCHRLTGAHVEQL
ncbi:nucleotide sugar dehydrogenase [Dactylosporangium siamense]|uniref:UDP-N-acetyl-D-glucosamine dehydrogenase n=1 Tax=Dactylosporangium siamense TaxID=685454 RepID=A0A919PHZ1_9ACTN|nr:nucleotide sugar dehydrogenase [Dactylosporangium siamense]GIG45195.1 UDP-N-acetyl-D-glucosamine dehydrogenase [Dactylosporangium siamense]